jgi:hypothetical protein
MICCDTSHSPFAENKAFGSGECLVFVNKPDSKLVPSASIKSSISRPESRQISLHVEIDMFSLNSPIFLGCSRVIVTENKAFGICNFRGVSSDGLPFSDRGLSHFRARGISVHRLARDERPFAKLDKCESVRF